MIGCCLHQHNQWEASSLPFNLVPYTAKNTERNVVHRTYYESLGLKKVCTTFCISVFALGEMCGQVFVSSIFGYFCVYEG